MKALIGILAVAVSLVLAGCVSSGPTSPADAHPHAWDATKESGHANSVGLY